MTIFFEYPLEIRKIIYMTSITESLNRQFRQIMQNKPSFTNDDSLRRMLYFASQRIMKLYGDKIFEKPGHGGTDGGNGGKPAEKGGKQPESRRESLIFEIDSQLSCPKTALTSVGVFFCAQRPQEATHRSGAARQTLARLNRKTPGKPHKNGNPGTFLDGRNGRGPLGHAPEVTAAVP